VPHCAGSVAKGLAIDLLAMSGSARITLLGKNCTGLPLAHSPGSRKLPIFVLIVALSESRVIASGFDLSLDQCAVLAVRVPAASFDLRHPA
jgi:hypothetical protein